MLGRSAPKSWTWSPPNPERARHTPTSYAARTYFASPGGRNTGCVSWSLGSIRCSASARGTRVKFVEGTTLATALVGRAGTGDGAFVVLGVFVRVITMAAGGAAGTVLVAVTAGLSAGLVFFPSMRSAAARSHLAAS